MYASYIASTKFRTQEEGRPQTTVLCNPRVTISLSLGSAGFICDLPNSLGELGPSVHRYRDMGYVSQHPR